MVAPGAGVHKGARSDVVGVGRPKVPLFSDRARRDAASGTSGGTGGVSALLPGTPPGQKSGRVNFNFANNLEIKVRSRKDTVTGMKKVKIIEALEKRRAVNHGDYLVNAKPSGGRNSSPRDGINAHYFVSCPISPIYLIGL